MSEQSEGLLTVAEVAAQKGVAPKTIYEAVREGRLRAQRVLNRIGIAPADADAFTPAPHGGRRRGAGVKAKSERVE